MARTKKVQKLYRSTTLKGKFAKMGLGNCFFLTDNRNLNEFKLHNAYKHWYMTFRYFEVPRQGSPNTPVDTFMEHVSFSPHNSFIFVKEFAAVQLVVCICSSGHIALESLPYTASVIRIFNPTWHCILSIACSHATAIDSATVNVKFRFVKYILEFFINLYFLWLNLQLTSFGIDWPARWDIWENH